MERKNCKTMTIKISHSGSYNGEYPRDLNLTEKQDLDQWEEMMLRVNRTDAVIELGHFSFGRNDPEDGRWHQKNVRYMRDRGV